MKCSLASFETSLESSTMNRIIVLKSS
jgi:hypothetical protein